MNLIGALMPLNNAAQCNYSHAKLYTERQENSAKEEASLEKESQYIHLHRSD